MIFFANDKDVVCCGINVLFNFNDDERLEFWEYWWADHSILFHEPRAHNDDDDDDADDDIFCGDDATDEEDDDDNGGGDDDDPKFVSIWCRFGCCCCCW